MPIHLPFQVPRIPDFLKRPLDPTQTLEAFEHYAEKAIDFATKHGGEIGRNVMDDLVDAATPYAAALDIGVDALLPGINLWYGEKWAQSRGRKDPFKQKGGIVKPAQSQLPAQRMPLGKRRSPFGDYERYVREQDKAIRRRLNPPQISRKSNAMKGNIALARRGRLSKKRKPKSKFYGVTRNYDDHGNVARDHAAYFCAQSHGSITRVFDIIGEAIAKRCLADLKIYPSTYDEELYARDTAGVIDYYPQLRINYRRVSDDGTVLNHDGDHINTFDFTTNTVKTFKQFAAAVATEIRSSAEFSVGFVPNEYIWVNANTNDNAHYKREIGVKSLATAIVSLTCKQVIKLQNVTPNDSGGLDTAQADRNPISGKVYTAGDHIPRVREALLTSGVHPEYDDFQKNTSTGMWGGPVLGVDNPIAHPPPAKHLFTNVKSVQSASMSAGGTMTKITYWTFKGTLKHLIERIYRTGAKKGTFGECVVFGFEQTHRTGSTMPVTLAVNREVHMKATISLKTKIPMLQMYDNTAVSMA